MESPPSEISPENDSGRNRSHHKKRVRVWTEDDRAKHRVFEKSRREAFSDSLLSLARFLPNLATVKESKLSKHTIVDESLKHHELQQAELEELQKTIDVLKSEKDSLLAELNQWRRCLDTPPQQAPAVAPGELPTTHEPTTYGLDVNDNTGCSGTQTSLNPTYGDPLVSLPDMTLGLTSMPMSSAQPADSFNVASQHIHRLDPHPSQQANLPLQASQIQDFPILPEQHPIHPGSYQPEAMNAAAWPQQRNQQDHQAFMQYQTYDSTHLDLRQYQF